MYNPQLSCCPCSSFQTCVSMIEIDQFVKNPVPITTSPMFGLHKLLYIPFIGGDVVSQMLTSLAAIIPKSEDIPDIMESLKNAETPLDLLIDYINFWARYTNIDLIKIDKRDGYIMTWEEMNAVWLDVLNILKENSGLPVTVIEAVWMAIANSVPEYQKV